MYDVSTLVRPAFPGGSFAIMVEHPNAQRLLVANVVDLHNAQRGLKECVTRWVEDASDSLACRAEFIDEYTALLYVGDTATNLYFFDPIPGRPEHPGDVVINRRIFPRKAIERDTSYPE